ncbi:MAG: type II toxin-antitoxin system VapC family toxin [Euryarchaeota archaeon]|nr:type II toxin-antitoxin system VapC family toxin [Euryarchaeota archaeon]
MVVLDTSFLIAFERREPNAVALRDTFIEDAETLRIPAAAWVEFLYRFGPKERREAARVLSEATSFEAFTQELAHEAAEIQHELEKRGRTLAWHDLQVAATATTFREPLVTRDLAFDRMPGLEIVRW